MLEVLIRRTAVSLGFPRLARAGVAVGVAVACLALNAASTSAAADSRTWAPGGSPSCSAASPPFTASEISPALSV